MATVAFSLSAVILSQAIKRDFENFETLFKRFLLKSGPSIVWSEIKSPPEGYVSSVFNELLTDNINVHGNVNANTMVVCGRVTKSYFGYLVFLSVLSLYSMVTYIKLRCL